ncbi:MAG: hypothetical protein GXO73_09145 [Calditrichaeota bacterium]|nr:hypothetical protein [Calditrichota bacterium]
MRERTMNLAVLTILATLWGALELTFGTALHALGVPFTGAVMTCLAVPFLVVGRLAVPRFGSSIGMGLVASFLKLLLMGGAAIGVVLGIMVETLLFDLALWTGPPRRERVALGGALTLAWSLVHPFFYLGLFVRWPFGQIYAWFLGMLERVLGLPSAWGLAAVSIAVAIYALIGAIAGWFSFSFAQLIGERSTVLQKLERLRNAETL